MEENEVLNESANNGQSGENKSRSSRGRSLVLRIISLFCAILLWFYVSEVESPTSEKSFEAISITLKNKDVLLSETDLSVISDALYETDVVLSGKKSVLNKLDYEDITASVDLSKLTEAGTHELQITINPPVGTKVVSSNPRYITVTIDKTVAKSFDIEADVSYSNLPSSYSLGEAVITDPQSKNITTVTVSGPQTEIERIDSVVARADFGSVESSVEAKVSLILLDYYGEEIPTTSVRISTPSVIVKLPVYVTKILPLTVSQAHNTFSSSQISFGISPARIEVKGDPKVLEDLNAIALDPINERQIGEALTTTVNSLIRLPEGVETTGGQNTATITATVKNVKCQYIEVKPEDFRVINKPSGLDVSFRDIKWKLVIINSSNKLVELSDMDLTIDLDTYESAGMYTINFVPKFKEEVSWAYSPNLTYTVSFELVKKEGATR